MPERNPPWVRDEIILALDLYFACGRRVLDHTDQRTIDLSEVLNRLPSAPGLRVSQKFRNPNGVGMKLANFKAVDPDRGDMRGFVGGSRLDRELFDTFYPQQQLLHQIAESIRQNLLVANTPTEPDFDGTDSDSDAIEGEILMRKHLVRERNKGLVAKKKKQVKDSTGHLRCEVCSFDFEETFGPLGSGFIECHHNVPLYLTERSKTTKLADLSLVCSNCHSMIHRTKPIVSVEGFKTAFGRLSRSGQ